MDKSIKPCTLGLLLYTELLLIPNSRENSKEPVVAIMERLKTQKEMQYPRKQRWNVDLDPAQENMGSAYIRTMSKPPTSETLN